MSGSYASHATPTYFGSPFFPGRNKNWGNWGSHKGADPFQNFAALVSFTGAAVVGRDHSIMFLGLRPGLRTLLLNLTGLVFAPLALYNLLDFMTYNTAYGSIIGKAWGADAGMTVYSLLIDKVVSVPYKTA